MLRARTAMPLRPKAFAAFLLWAALIKCGLWTGAGLAAALQMLTFPIF